MKRRMSNTSVGFSLAACFAFLLAIVAVYHGLGQLEYNHAATFFVAVSGVLVALAFICAWLAWASTRTDTESSQRDRERAVSDLPLRDER
jgi:hypothetical protein